MELLVRHMERLNLLAVHISHDLGHVRNGRVARRSVHRLACDTGSPVNAFRTTLDNLGSPLNPSGSLRIATTHSPVCSAAYWLIPASSGIRYSRRSVPSFCFFRTSILKISLKYPETRRKQAGTLLPSMYLWTDHPISLRRLNAYDQFGGTSGKQNVERRTARGRWISTVGKG